jgi:hypothetical protein
MFSSDHKSTTETPRATITQAIAIAQRTMAAEINSVTFNGFTPAATEAAAAN